MKIKLASAFIIYSFLCAASYAEDPINGAFGVKLGQSFNIQKSIGKGSLTDGTPMYKISPEKKFRTFSDYYVLITPKTNKIYSIWGIGNAGNDPSCKKEQALVMAILQKKYGKKNSEDAFSSIYDIKQINQGNRSVLTKCSGYVDVTIDIRYTDSKLEKQAENERIEIESDKLDSSGL